MPQHLSISRDDDDPARGRGLRIVVLVASWHGEITARLKEGALATLADAGVEDDDVLVVEVPGAYELPQAASWITRAAMADAVVALGCVIRGETPHFDFIARSCADGCLRAAQASGIPVTLGVITADTRAQALARSGEARGKGGNKGVEAADAAVRLALAYRALERRLRS
ncbi:MAG: 6,7-dimethyl-8-ribityllumazine synthase [Planctomycetota bacterium]|jgi:6,7-dimethyl-8-ribityllumazine synthase